jgi:sn-glycerol 3-phosphate transport system substrate-binding protein
MRENSFKTIKVLCLAAALLVGALASAQRTELEFWFGLGPPLGTILEEIVADFNESQDEFQVNPIFQGSYPETMISAIAAYRAGNAPHIVQMFEVGTATMMAAGEAIRPVHQLMEETGVEFDPDIYIPAIRGYYSLPDGRMVANSVFDVRSWPKISVHENSVHVGP